MVDLAETIFRDFVTDGVPASGPHKPKKSKIRELLTSFETDIATAFTSGSSVMFSSLTSLNANLGYAASTIAWVLGDPTVANDGIYQKLGASGTGSWVRRADLPYSFIRLSDVGAGTANAIQVTSSIPTSQSVIRVANVFEANAGNVTISENGGTAKPLVTNSGLQVPPGGLLAGGLITYLDDGTNFRLLSDYASAAIVAAAEAAQAAAEDAAALATGTLTTLIPNTFATQAVAEAYNPASGPDFMELAYLDSDQVGGSGGLYAKEASEPDFFPKFQITEGSWYGLRQKKHWKIEEFGAKEWDGSVDVNNAPTNPVYADTALSRIISRLGEGDVIDLGSMRLLFNDAVHLINGIERVKLVSNGKQRFNTLCTNDSGNIHITNCPGFMAEGNFSIEGPETLASWEALADVNARSEKRGIFHLDDGCHDAVFDGLFRTSNSRSPFIVEASRNPFVKGWRHTGFVPDAADIATGGAIPSYGTDDPNYLMTIRMLDCDAGTATNIRSTNHGSTFVNGGGGERVRCYDIYGTHMHDNVVYNSSGDDFLAYDIHGEHVIGTIAKSRGSNSTLRSIKGNHFVVGALLSPIDGTSGRGGLIDDVDVDTGLIAAQIDDVSGFFIDKVTLRGVVASNMKGTSGVIQTQTSGSGIVIENCHLTSYDATYGMLLDGGTAGEGNGSKHLSVRNNTFQTGNAAIQASKFREIDISGNMMDGMSATIVVQMIECFDGIITRNHSTDPAKRIFFHNASGDGCKRLRGIHNDMYVYGATVLNEYFGNYNKHLVDITGNIPFRVGQMGFDSSSGSAMVSDGNSATTDWNLLY